MAVRDFSGPIVSGAVVGSATSGLVSPVSEQAPVTLPSTPVTVVSASSPASTVPASSSEPVVSTSSPEPVASASLPEPVADVSPPAAAASTAMGSNNSPSEASSVADASPLSKATFTLAGDGVRISFASVKPEDANKALKYQGYKIRESFSPDELANEGADSDKLVLLGVLLSNKKKVKQVVRRSEFAIGETVGYLLRTLKPITLLEIEPVGPLMGKAFKKDIPANTEFPVSRAEVAELTSRPEYAGCIVAEDGTMVTLSLSRAQNTPTFSPCLKQPKQSLKDGRQIDIDTKDPSGKMLVVKPEYEAKFGYLYKAAVPSRNQGGVAKESAAASSVAPKIVPDDIVHRNLASKLHRLYDEAYAGASYKPTQN